MNLYLDSGWINMPKLIHRKPTFLLVVGTRQIGKSYGSLLTMHEEGCRYLYVRRSDAALESITDPEISPFLALERDGVCSYFLRKKKNIYHISEEDPDAEPVALGVALSTFYKLRGFSGRKFTHIIYDEFIKDENEKPLKEEFKGFMNLYMTINSVRELQGEPPVKCILLANSNTILNPIFMGWGLVTVMEQMQRSGENFWEDPERGITLVNAGDSPISERFQNTALFKSMPGENDFTRMALQNKYSDFEADCVSPQDLKQYKPVCIVGELCIYKHKAGRKYYVTTHKSGSPPVYTTFDADLKRFQRDQYRHWIAYLDRRVLFESFICKALFEKYYGM